MTPPCSTPTVSFLEWLSAFCGFGIMPEVINVLTMVFIIILEFWKIQRCPWLDSRVQGRPRPSLQADIFSYQPQKSALCFVPEGCWLTVCWIGEAKGKKTFKTKICVTSQSSRAIWNRTLLTERGKQTEILAIWDFEFKPMTVIEQKEKTSPMISYLGAEPPLSIGAKHRNCLEVLFLIYSS